MIIKNLSKQYDGKTVVDDVTFHIPKGKVISMIGPNGAGKSTVMGIISRLIARDSGMVDFGGKDIVKWNNRELAKRLAILTQSNNIQMKLTVRELVAFGRFPYSGGRLTKEDQDVIDKAVDYMELGDFQNLKIHLIQLRQRFLINHFPHRAEFGDSAFRERADIIRIKRRVVDFVEHQGHRLAKLVAEAAHGFHHVGGVVNIQVIGRLI